MPVGCMGHDEHGAGVGRRGGERAGRTIVSGRAGLESQ